MCVHATEHQLHYTIGYLCGCVCGSCHACIIISSSFILICISRIHNYYIYLLYYTHHNIIIIFFITSTTCRLLRFRSEDGLETLVALTGVLEAHLHRGQAQETMGCGASVNNVKANGASSPLGEKQRSNAREALRCPRWLGLNEFSMHAKLSMYMLFAKYDVDAFSKCAYQSKCVPVINNILLLRFG